MGWHKDRQARIVRRANRCPDCGREFILEYDPKDGAANQQWQRGCETMAECIKKHMPLSDFVEHKSRGERDRCATDGCEAEATELYDTGGVGSYHCYRCARKIEALKY